MSDPLKSLPIAAGNIVDSVREPLLILDDALRVRRANRSFYRTFAVTADDTIGQRIYDLGNGQWDIPALRHLLEEILPRSSTFDDYEVTHDFPSIGRKVMLLNARRVHGEGHDANAILLAIEDVTARRTAEQVLAVERERLRVTLASIGDAVVTTDTSGRIEFLNPVAEAVTAWPSADAIGRPLADVFRIVNETTREVVASPVTKALRTGEIVGLANHTILIRRDGREVSIDDSAAPIRDAAGTIVGAVLIFRDITARRKAESLLADQSEILERVVRGDAIAEVLEALCQLAERHSAERSIATVLLKDETGTLLRPAAGRSAPASDSHAINPVPIGPNQGSCGTASYLRTPVIVADIATDPLWADYRTTALAHGLRACWSLPIPGPAGDVLGTFAVYSLEPREPTEHDLTMLRMLARTAGLVVERKKSEDAIRDSRSRLESTLVAGEVGTWEFDVVRNTVRADLNLAQMFSVSPEAAVSGPLEAYLAAIHPADVAQVEAVIGRALAAGDAYEADYRLIDPNGSVRWVIARGRIERDADGRPLRLPGVVVDVTRQRIAEAALRESEERYRSLFESMDEGFCVIEMMFDAAGRPVDYLFLEANPAFVRQCGLPDAVGKTMRQLVPDHDEHWFETYGRVAVTGDPIRFVNRGTAMGDLWWDVYAFRLGGPDSRRVAVLFNDITSRKKSEDAVREAEERFRMLADNMSQFAWMADSQGSVFWYNRRWYDYTGTNLEQMQGWGWTAVHHPDHVDRVVKSIQHSWDTGELWDATFPLRSKEGSFRWFLSRAVPIRDESGRIVRWFGTNTDITDQLSAEDRLREADRRKDEFLATLAHELRNPLAPIRNSLQIIGLAEADRDVVATAREIMERQVAQMVRLIDDLLEISRISQGKIHLQLRRTTLASILDNAIEVSSPLIETSGHELFVVPVPRGIVLDADPTRLTQVFLNLLNNAAKYSERGGRITLSSRFEDGSAVVTVRDTGVGITSENLPKVFDMFTQVDRSLEKSHGGLGIGLALVRRLVELHGGTVEAFSEGIAGRGSVFTVTLPATLERQPTMSDGPDGGDLKAGLPVQRILVADDNIDAATSLAALLRLLGNEVRVVHDGAAAVDMVDEFRPDVVLLDIGMPRLNGYDACRQIRERANNTKLVVIALTGWGQDEDRRLSTDAGFDHHLVKPVDLVALSQLLAARHGVD